MASLSMRSTSALTASASRPLAAPRPACTPVVRSRRTAVRVAAQLKTPAGVTLPPRQPQVPPPKNGFVDYAERMNSRAAMIGWIALLVLEGATGKGLFELIGLKVGGGLGFEL